MNTFNFLENLEQQPRFCYFVAYQIMGTVLTIEEHGEQKINTFQGAGNSEIWTTFSDITTMEQIRTIEADIRNKQLQESRFQTVVIVLTNWTRLPGGDR